MVVPTVTINEVSEGINRFDDPAKKVLIGIMNDYMDLMYAKNTPYTTGQVVLPNGCSIEDLDAALTQGIDQKYVDVIKIIAEVHKSGDRTPRSKNGDNGYFWDPSLTPVLVVVRPNN